MAEKDSLALKEYSSRLHKLYSDNIEKIILFGSRARGDARDDSDTDLLIVVKNGSRELNNNITDLAFEIILEYGIDIEPAIFDSREWMRLVKNPTSFVYSVLQEGREL